MRIPDDNPKAAIGITKPSLQFLPPVALYELAGAMQDGAAKYGPFNWREYKISISTYYDAMMRHNTAFWDGEDLAPDSRRHHVAHTMACCAIILDALDRGMLIDDRPKVKGGTGDYIRDHTEKDKTDGSTKEHDHQLSQLSGGARPIPGAIISNRGIEQPLDKTITGEELPRRDKTRPPWFNPTPEGSAGSRLG